MFTSGSPDNEAIRKTSVAVEKNNELLEKLNATLEKSNFESANYNELMKIFTVVILLLTLIQMFLGFASLSFEALETSFPDRMTRFFFANLVGFVITIFAIFLVNKFTFTKYGFRLNELIGKKDLQIKPD